MEVTFERNNECHVLGQASLPGNTVDVTDYFVVSA